MSNPSLQSIPAATDLSPACYPVLRLTASPDAA
jgi:hypothetical protein